VNDIINDLLELVDEVGRTAKLRREMLIDTTALSATENIELRSFVAQPSDSGYGIEDIKRLYLRGWRRQSGLERATMVRVKDVTRRYTGSEFRLGPISCDLNAGEITGIVGMNASGKTTFLRMILGELAPDRGAIDYIGLSSSPSEWMTIKSSIAYVAQLPNKWAGRLRHNLNHTAAAYGITGNANIEFVDHYVHRYGLYTYQDSTWDEISGGFKIRFELVRALLSQPKLLVLDEPLAYLDIVTQQIFLNDITTIARSFERPVPVVVTSQHLYEIEAVADHMIILDDGHCLFSGPTGEIPESDDHYVFEISVSCDKSALLNTMRTAGLVDIEKTATSWILIFDKRESRGKLIKILINSFKNDIRYFRDISQSTRLLFRNRRDDFEPRTPS
jgi:ABC-2 type transport system ATP-binding protein